MLRKVFVVPTVGERYNPNNPLRPAITPPPGVAHTVVKYINNDKQAILVVFGKNNSDFIHYAKKGKELKTVTFDLTRFKRRYLKDQVVIDSTDINEIGKKEWQLYGLSKSEFLKKFKVR